MHSIKLSKSGLQLSNYLDQVDDDDCFDTKFVSSSSSTSLLEELAKGQSKNTTSITTTTTVSSNKKISKNNSITLNSNTITTNVPKNNLPTTKNITKNLPSLQLNKKLILFLISIILLFVSFSWILNSTKPYLIGTFVVIINTALLIPAMHAVFNKTANKHSLVKLSNLLEQVQQIEILAKRALRLIKHAELRVRGFSLTENFPPIARIERSETFNHSETTTFQCKPLRRTLHFVLSQVNKLLLRLVNDDGDISKLLTTVKRTTTWNDQDTNHLYIESLNIIFSKTKELYQDAENELSIDENGGINNQTRAIQSLNMLKQLYMTLKQSFLEESNVNINDTDHKEKNDNIILSDGKKKRQVARITAPFNLSVNNIRSSLNSTSVSLFCIIQDTHELITDSVCNTQNNICNKSAYNNKWNDISIKITKNKKEWIENYENMLNHWNMMEENMIKMAKSFDIALQTSKVNLNENDHLDYHNDNNLIIPRATTTSDSCINQSMPSETSSMLELSDHISVFEAVAKKQPRETARQLREKESLRLRAAATGGNGEIRIHLNTELSNVLTNLKKIPELVRKPDRSGWSEKMTEEKILIDEKEEIISTEQKRKDHDMSVETPFLKRRPNMMAELLKSLPVQQTSFDNQ
jgi:hypothetical protein